MTFNGFWETINPVYILNIGLVLVFLFKPDQRAI